MVTGGFMSNWIPVRLWEASCLTGYQYSYGRLHVLPDTSTVMAGFMSNRILLRLLEASCLTGYYYGYGRLHV